MNTHSQDYHMSSYVTLVLDWPGVFSWWYSTGEYMIYTRSVQVVQFYYHIHCLNIWIPCRWNVGFYERFLEQCRSPNWHFYCCSNTTLNYYLCTQSVNLTLIRWSSSPWTKSYIAMKLSEIEMKTCVYILTCELRCAWGKSCILHTSHPHINHRRQKDKWEGATQNLTLLYGPCNETTSK